MFIGVSFQISLLEKESIVKFFCLGREVDENLTDTWQWGECMQGCPANVLACFLIPHSSKVQILLFCVKICQDHIKPLHTCKIIALHTHR